METESFTSENVKNEDSKTNDPIDCAESAYIYEHIEYLDDDIEER